MGYSIIKLRRGTLYENSVNNVLLQEGELILEAPDTGVGTGLSKFKIGDGVTRYRDLPYAFDGSSANSILGGSASESALIQIRSDNSPTWKAIDPVLAKGEFGYDTDNKWFKVGDGVSSWNELDWIGGKNFDAISREEVFDCGDEDASTALGSSNTSIEYAMRTGRSDYTDSIFDN